MTLTLIVGDLHLASGRDPVTGKYSPLDDFYADSAFSRFLAHYHGADAASHLVLNGDTFDLAQVVELPPSEEVPGVVGSGSLDRDRLRYGLGHSAAETCWKLSRVAAGHPLFFEALGAWVRRRQHVHFVFGNHDVELRHASAQDRLVELIAAAQPDLAPAAARPYVHFHAWYMLQPEQQLYVEHGGQYEPLAYVQGGDLPACYFNNRYLFNLLEVRTPEADNIFPFSRYISWLLATDTIPTLAILLRQLPDFLRARGGAGDALPPAAPPASRLPAAVEEAIEQAAASQRRVIGRSTYRTTLLTLLALVLLVISHLSPMLAVALALSGSPVLAVLALAAWPILRAASNSITGNYLHRSFILESDFLEEASRRLAPVFSRHGIRTVAFGHTHQGDLARLPGGLRYYNTGTWIPIFSEDTRLDTRERSYLFVEVRDGEARLRRWDPATGEIELPTIIDRRGRIPRRAASPLAARGWKARARGSSSARSRTRSGRK
jgi:UDP-2,3-diacylglucosamine pyrophosphatase LpxH